MKCLSPGRALVFKIGLTGFLALLMLIPLSMIREQIQDRQQFAQQSVDEVSAAWGRAQVLAGPCLRFQWEQEEKDADGKVRPVRHSETVYPRTLRYDIDVDTQLLHRSIYDIMVYHADVRSEGAFILPADRIPSGASCTLSMGIEDLRGIGGNPAFTFGDESACFSQSSGQEMFQEVVVRPELFDGKTLLPFTMSIPVKGSHSLKVKPYGDATEVTVRSDCPSPSFCGDFLPEEREIRPDGFQARWSVSQINRGAPDDALFGVDLLQGITQYQQATRTVKYGILIILLVFIAGLAVEWVTRREIHLIQYLVIGLSLVLFYALVLSFSEFMAFGWAYLLAAALTVSALLGYFLGILKHRSAYVLALLVALAYALSYILLQMQTYALLSGTLLLFVMLVIVMYFTRNLAEEIRHE